MASLPLHADDDSRFRHADVFCFSLQAFAALASILDYRRHAFRYAASWLPRRSRRLSRLHAMPRHT